MDATLVSLPPSASSQAAWNSRLNSRSELKVAFRLKTHTPPLYSFSFVALRAAGVASSASASLADMRPVASATRSMTENQ